MFKTTLKALICTSALVSAASTMDTTAAQAGGPKFKAPINFAKSMQFRKSPAIRAFKAPAFRAPRPAIRMSRPPAFTPRTSRVMRNAPRVRSVVRTPRPGPAPVRIHRKIGTASQFNRALTKIKPLPRVTNRRLKPATTGNNAPRHLSQSALGKNIGRHTSKKTTFKVPLALGRNSDLAKTIRNKAAENFTIGGTVRYDNAPLQFFGSRANKPATLSTFNRNHLGQPWQRNVPKGFAAGKSGSSPLALGRNSDLVKTLRAIGKPTVSVKTGGIGSMRNNNAINLFRQQHNCFEFDCVKTNAPAPAAKAADNLFSAGRLAFPDVLKNPGIFSGHTSKAERSAAESSRTLKFGDTNVLIDPKATGFGTRSVLNGIFGGKDATDTGIVTQLPGKDSRLNDALGVAGDTSSTHTKPAGVTPQSIIDPHPTAADPHNPFARGSDNGKGKTGGLTGLSNPRQGWLMNDDSPDSGYVFNEDGSGYNWTVKRDEPHAGHVVESRTMVDSKGKKTGQTVEINYDGLLDFTETTITYDHGDGDPVKFEFTNEGKPKNVNWSDHDTQSRDCAATWNDDPAACRGDFDAAAVDAWVKRNSVAGGRVLTPNIDWRINPDPNATSRPTDNVTKADVEAARAERRAQQTLPNPLGSPTRYISEEEAAERYRNKQAHNTDPSPVDD